MEFKKFVNISIREVYERMLAAYQNDQLPEYSEEFPYDPKNDFGPYICHAINSIVRYDKLSRDYDVDSGSVLSCLEGWFGRPLVSNLNGIEECFTHAEMMNFIRLGAAAVDEVLRKEWNPSSDGKWNYAPFINLKMRFWSRIGMLVDVMKRKGEFEFEVMAEV